MQENKVYIGQDAHSQTNRQSSSLAPFTFGNGYSLAAFDLGGGGVKMELRREDNVEAAIILPPEEVGNLGRWLLATLGQDEHGFPVELSDILERISKTKVALPVLERGDKKRIKQAIRALRA
jgi:hypothetical protein